MSVIFPSKGQSRWSSENYIIHDGMQDERFNAINLLYCRNAKRPQKECGVDAPQRGTAEVRATHASSRLLLPKFRSQPQQPTPNYFAQDLVFQLHQTSSNYSAAGQKVWPASHMHIFGSAGAVVIPLLSMTTLVKIAQPTTSTAAELPTIYGALYRLAEASCQRWVIL